MNNSTSELPTKNRITIRIRLSIYRITIPDNTPIAFFLIVDSKAITPATKSIIGSVPSHPNDICTEKLVPIITSPTCFTPTANQLIIIDEKKAVLRKYCSNM